MVPNPAKPFAAQGHAGEEDVGSFAFQVLGVCYSPYPAVQLFAAISAADVDGLSIVLPQGLQNLLAQVLEVVDGRLIGHVADATGGSGVGTDEFVQTEMFCLLVLHFPYLFAK